jgi:hypothetical protein
MFGQVLASVFASAAVPQKMVLILLTGALPLTVLATVLAFRNDAGSGMWRRLVPALGLSGPALGLLVGALNAFHMGQTIQRLPFDPTAKQLAPGILEVSTLVGVGALVGVIATIAHLTLGFASRRR